MFDPAQLGSQLQPGDKISLTFHKGQPKSTGGSFVDNARQAGAIPGGPSVPPASGPAATMPGLMTGAPSAGLPDSRSLLVAAMRRRMGLV